ncbi:tetratricopeptide repeat protein [Endozoicomonas sp. SM1973]|uniref:Tetratricopeptide repeat protein n=1 Tax=Spartinivicinus marinus TaxID=2994442 RepID=A0A853IEW1_9GAMM|nr:tetratricopeptide repeat-containing response regulator [Spartinivicinus marinus]MCX4025294.1 tetratricopeptide repeat protein [Spartinivicinus marinus]NYZ66016.1 tetratricopeptide repeat protein [Spartinivicinus marinus]
MDFFETITTTPEVTTTTNIFSKKKLLIVDDFESFRLSLKRMMVDIGISSIDMVQNGKLAIASCSQQPYDIIICDFNLGEGKNGQQVLEELRHLKLLKPNSIFIMVTAETTKEMVMGALECQPDAYLSKPINQAVLKKRLENLVKQSEKLAPVKQLITKKAYKQAIEKCKDALKNENRFSHWYEKQLCELFILTEQYDEAKNLCNSILAARTADWPHQMLGQVNQILGNSDQAIKNYEALFKINPNAVAAYDEIADVYLSKGDTEKAQKAIQQATNISPNTMARQQKLGKISREIGDLDVAVNAFRYTIELGKNSCFDCADNYVELASSLVDLSEESDSIDKQKALSETSELFKKVNKRFTLDINTSIKIDLTKARTLYFQKNKNASNEIIEKINSVYNDQNNQLSADTKFEIGKTFFVCNHKDVAETILFQLVEEKSDDKIFVNKILAFLDEPVSQKNKNEAAIANKEGIHLYEQKEYQKAIEQFQQALEHSPRNPGLNLNLIQACLYLLQEKFSLKWLDLCEQSLFNVKHLREHHPQYARYQKLAKPVEQWKRKAQKA